MAFEGSWVASVVDGFKDIYVPIFSKRSEESFKGLSLFSWEMMGTSVQEQVH